MCRVKDFVRLLVIFCGIAVIIRSQPTRLPSSISSICKVSISELHFSQTEKPFIELYEYCTRRKTGLKTLKALRGYKLLLVSSEEEKLVMVVDLGNESLKFRDEEKFYVLDGRKSPTDLGTIGTSAAQSISLEKGNFPVEPGKSYGLFLIRSTDTKVKDFKLQRQFRDVFKDRSLTAEMKSVITSNLVDFMSFCTSSTCSSVTPFVSILGHLSPLWKEVPDFPAATPLSIGYCGPNSIEYNRVHFLQTTPTPGEPNRCFNRASVATSSEQPQNLLPPSNSVEDMDCVSSDVVKEQGIAGLRTQRRRTERVEILKQGVGQIDEHAAWMCKGSLPDAAALLKRKFIESWVQVSIVNSKCFFYCRVCSKFFQVGFRPDLNKIRKRQKITKDGVSNTKPIDNHKDLMDHINHPVHVVASQMMEETKTDPENIADIVERYEESEYRLYKPTIDLIRLAYTEIVSDVPFSGHETFVESLKLMGLDMGMHHYDNAGYLAITKTISEDFRLTLLQYLVAAGNPFSLVLDGSHDNTNNHLFCVLIQSLEESHPMMYFYRLIHLKKGETSNDIVAALMAKVEEDHAAVPGFKDFFLSKIYGMASDGASVMTGIRNSVHAKLKTISRRHIVLSKCMAHSLELSTKQAVKSLGTGLYIQSLEGKANKPYTYYMSRGSSRWIRFNAVGDRMGIKVKRFKAHYPIRWSSSHYEVMTSLWHNYYVVLRDVNAAKEDKKTPLKARKSANSVFEIFSDKQFPLYVNEMIDYLGAYKSLSLEFERSKGTLIGKKDVVLQGLQRLEYLKGNVGPNVTSFLKSCVCTGVCDGTCSVEQYGACKDLKCEGAKLTGESLHGTEFRQVRHQLYTNSINQLHKYFDFDRLEAYNVMDLRQSVDNSDITKFCNFHKWDDTVCTKFRIEFNQFSNDVRSLYASQLQSKEPVELWSLVLSNTEINFSSFLNETLRGVLTVPVSSADAERVFSLMTRIKSRERSSLSPENLEHLIRIKINGPKELNEFDAFYYATVFLTFHVRSDDCTVGSRNKASPFGSSRRSKLF